MNVMFEVGAALLEGACKYGRHNYRVYGVRSSVYFDAAMRHLARYWEGEDIDPDSGIHHVTKAIAGLTVLRDAMMNSLVNDDRPPRLHREWAERADRAAEAVLDKYPEPKAPYTEVDHREADAA